jgi:hypothetical protein
VRARLPRTQPLLAGHRHFGIAWGFQFPPNYFLPFFSSDNMTLSLSL